MVRETVPRHPDLIKIWVDDMHGTVPNKMNPVIYKAVIDEAHANHLRVAAHIYYLDDAERLVNDGIDILAHGVRDKPVDTNLIQAMKARGVWYIPTLGLDETFFVFAEHPPWMQQPFFRHALQPALALGIAMLLHLPLEQMRYVVLISAMPCGFFGAVFGKVFDANPRLASSGLIASHVVSVGTLAAWIVIVQHLK